MSYCERLEMAKKQIGLLLPAVQQVRLVSIRNYQGPFPQKMATAYQNKCAYVKRIAGSLHAAQYKQLQDDFIQLNKGT